MDPHLAELRRALDHAELALASGDARTSLALVDPVLADPATAGAPYLLRVGRQVRASALECLGDLDGAIALLEELATEPVPDASWLKALIALSRCHRDRGDFAPAIAVGERFAATIAELGLEGRTEAIQLTVTVAGAYQFAGDPGTAMRLCLRAVEAADRYGSPVGKASAYWNASLIEATRGRTAEALRLASDALVLFEQGEDHRNLVKLRSQVAHLHLLQDPPDPFTALGVLDDVAVGMGHADVPAWDRAFVHVSRARARYLLGDHDAARECLAEVARVRPPEAPLIEAQWLVLHGRLALAEGDHATARDRYRTAIHALTAAGADLSAAQRWFELAALLEEVGDTEGAAQAFRSAGASTGLNPLPGA